MNTTSYPNPTIETFPEQLLVGLHMEMSVANNTTGLLWATLGPRIKEIKNISANYKISLQEYPIHYFKQFNPNSVFTKWALIPVYNIADVSEGLESYTISEGLYAMFQYKGASTNSSIFQYIFTEWLPKSPYILDHRPHFEVLGENYKNNDDNSEEKIYIPVKLK
ncbi:GyrI-like domain-containing protein [Flavobacterium sp. ASW18X]|uniref:GyrI-like domain-containing protein n=1 Tax=Flavobacterium sp. ASW18X TaxID=2572595 RepID=UPI0010ADEB1E|nr:GyrI-like domain-containing protein [Flavobacterium sp. ASW18X]TKD66572.1 GyrI-like domain-containing protein [Flavobacterium sp. ASW18X]